MPVEIGPAGVTPARGNARSGDAIRQQALPGPSGALSASSGNPPGDLQQLGPGSIAADLARHDTAGTGGMARSPQGSHQIGQPWWSPPEAAGDLIGGPAPGRKPRIALQPGQQAGPACPEGVRGLFRLGGH